MIEKIKFLRPLLPQIEVLHRWMFPAWFAASSAKVFHTIEPEVLLLPLLVRPESVAIDVGAHYGAYVWHLLKLAGRVEAFEPNPVLAKFLQAAFKKGVAVHEVALSGLEGSARLEMRYNNLDKTYNFAEARISQELHETPKYAYVDVKTRRLDGLGVQNVSFIKIDVEGHEIDVLDGCDAVLRQQKPNLLIEAENRHRANAVQSLASYLCNYGYDGFFLLQKKIHKICDFEEGMQNRSKLVHPELGHRRQYVNNFIFIHRQSSERFIRNFMART